MDLGTAGLQASLFNRHIGIYSAGTIQGFGEAETMAGREQMPPIKVSGDGVRASKGGGWVLLSARVHLLPAVSVPKSTLKASRLSQRGGGACRSASE